MFKDSKGFAGFSVNDLAKAKEFYGQTLGLATTEMSGMLELSFPDNGKVVIYPKEDHQPAVFTVLNLPVNDIEASIEELKNAGITMEHYDKPGFKTDEKGIVAYEGTKAAWFKDPAGNIIALLEGM